MECKDYDPTNKCIFHVGMFMAGARRDSLRSELFDLLPLMKTNRQLYREVLPLWFEHNEVKLTDDSLRLRNTVAWFKAIAPARLRLVKRVAVNVGMEPKVRFEKRDRKIWRNPLIWLKLEEEVLPKGIKVAFLVDYCENTEVWARSYNVAKRCRKLGMPWEQVEMCMLDIRSALTAVDWDTRSPEGSEGEDEDGDVGIADMSEAEEDEERVEVAEESDEDEQMDIE